MMRALLGILAISLISTAASAQEREIENSTVPRDLADRLIGIANDPGTVRLLGSADIPSDSVILGNVVVMGGLRLAGTVHGELIVVNGDVYLAPGSEVTGGLAVVGGEIRGEDEARVGGTMMAFQPPSGRFSTVLSELAPTSRSGGSEGVYRRFDRDGRSGLRLSFGEYNRIEGLPVALGPRFTTEGRNPFRVEAQVIWRTEGQAPFQEDRLGYRVEGEQFFGGRREIRVGGGFFSSISPIEGRGLSDGENSISTFAFTSDQRDYFESYGGHAYLRLTPHRVPLDFRVGYRDERMGSVAAQDPWSLFNRGRSWRPQPVVAEGQLRSIVGQIGLDTRDDHENPGRGWLIQATWQEGVGGHLQLPQGSIPIPDPALDATAVSVPEFDVRFSSALVDVRRYNSVGGGNQLNLRGVIGGSPTNKVLPPQNQVTLGGPGTLPGYPSFAADCGARGFLIGLEHEGGNQPMVPSYGCDRFALFQAEYRGSLGGFFGWGGRRDDRGRRSRSGGHPRWVVFFDAGRAWTAGDWGEFARVDSPALYDAGLGLLLGGLGIYWARPFGDAADGSRLLVRLDRRF